MDKSIYTSFELEFHNTKTRKKRRVQFNIESHELAQRWAGMLEECLRQDLHIEKNYLFHGWLGNNRNLEFLCSELNRHIQIINNFFASRPQGIYYRIDQVFDPKTVDQNELNKIHHDFELLLGQVWNPSKAYLAADMVTKNAIRQLNLLCHESEHFRRSEFMMREHRRCASNIFAAFLSARRLDLLPEDQKYFDLRLRFGDVKLHYAQIGKTFMDAYNDKDDVVHDTGVSELRYLTGEFDISLSDEPSDEEFQQGTKNFMAWLQQKKVDTRHLNLGSAKVASLDRTQFPEMSSLEIMQELFEFDDISAITLWQGARSYTRKYKYALNDPGYELYQMQVADGVQPPQKQKFWPLRISLWSALSLMKRKRA